MKKIVLILGMLIFGLTTFSQTLIHTDTLLTDNDTIFLKWYHERFTDADGDNGNFELISRIGLVKDYVLTDTTYEGVMTHYHRVLSESDSLKNPYGNNYYQATFIRTYIYSSDENMKRQLSLFWLLNEPKRIMQ